MAAATDEAGIQFRILNSSKGPAVRATRAQADRVLYRAAIRRRLENQPNLWLFQQAVDDLMIEGDRVVGAVTQVGIRFHGSAIVVLTAGTFLDGRIHVGLQNHSAGRAGDPAGDQPVGTAEGAEAAARAAEDRHAAAHRRPLDRLLEARRAARRPRSDAGVQLPGRRVAAPAASAVLDHAHERAHARDHPQRLRPQPDVHRRDRRVGPRYCPSIEDKVNRFADKASHQIFLEPEGLCDERGLSERHLDVVAVRRATGGGAVDARAGERAHPAPGLRDRVRLLRSARAAAELRDEGDPRAVTSPGRSTAPPATRRRRRKACTPGVNAALAGARARAVGAAPRRGLPGRAGR